MQEVLEQEGELSRNEQSSIAFTLAAFFLGMQMSLSGKSVKSTVPFSAKTLSNSCIAFFITWTVESWEKSGKKALLVLLRLDLFFLGIWWSGMESWEEHGKEVSIVLPLLRLVLFFFGMHMQLKVLAFSNSINSLLVTWSNISKADDDDDDDETLTLLVILIVALSGTKYPSNPNPWSGLQRLLTAMDMAFSTSSSSQFLTTTATSERRSKEFEFDPNWKSPSIFPFIPRTQLFKSQKQQLRKEKNKLRKVKRRSIENRSIRMREWVGGFRVSLILNSLVSSNATGFHFHREREWRKREREWRNCKLWKERGLEIK